MATTLYLDNTVSPYAPTAGKKSTANPVSTLGANNASGNMEASSLTTTRGVSSNWGVNSDATTAARSNYIARFVSSPLTAQSIASGTWSGIFNLNENNTNANSFLALSVYLAAPGGSARKATIYDAGTNLGTEWGLGTGTSFTFTGAAVSAQAGDVLVIEVWRNATQGMGTVYAQSINFGGAADATAGGTGTGSYIQTPAAVNLSFAQLSLSQAAFRLYADGTETGSTALANLNTNYTADLSSGDLNLQLRFRVQETSAAVSSISDSYQLYASQDNVNFFPINGAAAAYSFSNSTGSTIPLNGTGNTGVAESFISMVSGTLDKVTFLMWKSGSPTGNAFAKIYNVSGTVGTTAVPTGTAIATSDPLDVTTLVSGNNGQVSFSFSGANRITLSANSSYAVSVEYSGGDSSNRIFVEYVTSSTYSGNYSIFVSAWNASSFYDLPFQVNLVNPTGVTTYDSPNVVDGTSISTANFRLGAGSGSAVAGAISEDGEAENISISAGNYTELLYTASLKSSQLSGVSNLYFKVYRNSTALTTYSVTPIIGITFGSGPPVVVLRMALLGVG